VAAAIQPQPRMATVWASGKCVGFTLDCGRYFQACDGDGRLLATAPDKDAAAAIVLDQGRHDGV